MTHGAGFATVAIAVAGVFTVSTATLAAPKKQQKPAELTYEHLGAIKGMAPPVPGFAVSSYKPGMCWKVNNGTWQTGAWVKCSEWHKRGD